MLILGAGYDARAYRLEALAEARVFEVDNPNTQVQKRERLRKISKADVGLVIYVSLDFDRDSLRDALARASFDPQSRTLFLWEGVTNYLTEDGVNATLEFVGSVADGSKLIFTYVDSEVLRDPQQFDGGERLQRMFRRIEERWTFGLDPTQTSKLLSSHGLLLIDDIDSVTYRAKYMGKSGPHLRGYEFYRVAVADVNNSIRNAR
jgi:methyltransferase (TIGR00027 family)